MNEKFIKEIEIFKNYETGILEMKNSVSQTKIQLKTSTID